MAKNDVPNRKMRGYYKFSKNYPSKSGTSSNIGENRKTRRRERVKKVFLALFLCCLFAASCVLIMFLYDLSTRPLPETETDNPIQITSDNIGTVRAVYIDNGTLGEISELSEALSAAKKNGFNAVMLDFKTRDGYLTYDSSLSGNTDTSPYNRIDTAALDRIKDEELLIIARIFCFEDSVAPQRIGAYIYEDAEKTQIWFDAPAVSGGRVWLDPTSQAAQNYLCSVIEEAAQLADGIYLQSVEFPVSREGAEPIYTDDDTTLNRNSVLQQFIERAVASAGERPVIVGVPLEGADGGDAEKWGGTLFDTAAPVCSPLLLKPADGDYTEYIENAYTVYNDTVKNNFSTIRVIPTVINQTDDPSFYEKLARSHAESYIIVP
ncbi:MAG: hypothetical protein J1F23_06215 [Oscillospiraceae bacterium]|nr:hypothetical protein [Oscillospiraceae bacterium]